MPELPEVETTRRGIEPHLLNHRISRIVVRDPRLRWPVPDAVQGACGQVVSAVRRRAKYLLLETEPGVLLVHLGMTGSFRVLLEPKEPGKHDHFDIVTDRAVLRFNDPRRFGTFTWCDHPWQSHPLLASLGPEPLSGGFDGDHLYRTSRNRRVAVKNFIMDGRVVVGVGNIYASEALFMAGIHPLRKAGRVSRERYAGLAEAIRDVLSRAIELGGTTLRDFSGTGGTPGYFMQELLVYGRAGQGCFQCGSSVRQKVIGQRSSFYCLSCQR
ncbi:MAG: bifunctional DNA-formamidopyrimidine glycosylase/DNA-(apurinic or apyrimidinic site) lyase [Xanthomonadales bacterium]|nr:bifunctional DNA-formamidopyrimidine glycosylase/DNA-(apurinic or apyrimidinic site) lyase [Xanthomonadales bacterium]NIX13285.1 bifunctional DNA-formamidopyrimidine glycosylase/DNA-(apurinic or apyrimidinic site) lyase [Xanthomonadales bacterium]